VNPRVPDRVDPPAESWRDAAVRYHRVEEAAARFRGADPELVRRQLELLVGTGEARRDAEGRYHRVELAV
jgi:hypothetical protein